MTSGSFKSTNKVSESTTPTPPPTTTACSSRKIDFLVSRFRTHAPARARSPPGAARGAACKPLPRPGIHRQKTHRKGVAGRVPDNVYEKERRAVRAHSRACPDSSVILLVKRFSRLAIYFVYTAKRNRALNSTQKWIFKRALRRQKGVFKLH